MKKPTLVVVRIHAATLFFNSFVIAFSKLSTKLKGFAGPEVSENFLIFIPIAVNQLEPLFSLLKLTLSRLNFTFDFSKVTVQ